MKEVKEFTYLESFISGGGKMEVEMSLRFSEGSRRMVMGGLGCLWRSGGVPIVVMPKVIVIQSVVWGLGLWGLNSRESRKKGEKWKCSK